MELKIITYCACAPFALRMRIVVSRRHSAPVSDLECANGCGVRPRQVQSPGLSGSVCETSMSLSGCHWLCFFLLSLALVVRAEQTIGRSRAPPEKPCVPLASGSVVENVSVRSEGCRVTVTWESSQATPNASYHYQVQVSTPHWSTSTSTPSQQAHVTLPPPPPPSPAHQCVELVVGVRVVMVCGGGGAGGEEGNWTRVEGVKVCSCVGGDGGRGVRSVVFGGIMGAVAVGSLVFLSVCGLLYWRHQRHLSACVCVCACV